jgi:hypothetical protein
MYHFPEASKFSTIKNGKFDIVVSATLNFEVL